MIEQVLEYDDQQQGLFAEFVEHHWNDLLSLTPREVTANVVGLWGLGELLVHRDDGIRVLKGMGKVALGLVLANTGRSGRGR